MTEEIIVKGIILKTSQYGEYGRRLVILTDKLGKITVFAGGASKSSSKIIGVTRPMVCADFRLAKGRGAWSLHGADIIDSFEELAFDIDKSMLSMYVLEFAEYFAQEGIVMDEAKKVLNLIYVTLDAIRKSEKSLELIRRVYELKMLTIEGECPEHPVINKNGKAADLWNYVYKSPLTSLYAFPGEEEQIGAVEFIKETDVLVTRQIPHRFKVLEVLREL